jgi:two-component system, NarL family, sensor histidine kinase YdfH
LYTVRSSNGANFVVRYNPTAMDVQKKSPFQVEQDYRIFFAFMTLVLTGMYVLTLVENTSLRQSWLVVPFTILMIVHILLHWMVIRIIQTPSHQAWYVIGQGLLAFVIASLSQNTGMVLGLFMALIGETLGFLGITRWGALATLYYVILSLISFLLTSSPDRALFWLITIIPLIIFIGMYVTLYVRQADARERAQALASDLEAANRQLTEYAAQVEDLTIANERQRMARELHDTLSQGLAGLILQLEAADAHLASNRREKAQAIVANAMVQARATLADARRAIDDLRRPSPDDLDSALRLEVSRFTYATGIPVEFHTTPAPPLPDPVKEAVIRTVAEALTNIAHHARAQHVEIDTQVKEGQLSIAVQDDGVGFDPSAIPSGHYGLLGIQERVRLVNGCFEIKSEPNRGTTLTIHVPLSPLPLASKP